MVLHRLVDVEVGAAGRVETGEQFVHHDEQPHVGRLLDEQALGLVLVGFGIGLAGLGLHRLEKIGVEVEEKLFVGFRVRACLLLGDVLGLRVVGSDDGTAALERGFLEQLVVAGRLVDAGCHEHGIATLADEAGFHAEVEEDVLHHPLHAGTGAEDFLHGAPLLAQGGLLPFVEAIGFGLKPLVDLAWFACPP